MDELNGLPDSPDKKDPEQEQRFEQEINFFLVHILGYSCSTKQWHYGLRLLSCAISKYYAYLGFLIKNDKERAEFRAMTINLIEKDMIKMQSIFGESAESTPEFK